MDSLHQLEQEILQLLAVVIASAALWLIKRALAWFKLKLSADRQAAVESVVNRVMSLGVTKADAMIRAKGWDHIDSKNAVVDYALPIISDRFAAELNAAGIDLDSEEGRMRLIRTMDRIWPDVATRLSASPATPPAPVLPVAVAIPPAA